MNIIIVFPLVTSQLVLKDAQLLYHLSFCNDFYIEKDKGLSSNMLRVLLESLTIRNLHLKLLN